MRKLVFFYLVVALTSCSTDPFTPCLEEGIAGNLCREYRYLNNRAQGYVAYKVNGDSATVSDFYNQNSKLTKTVIERLENGQTKVIAEQYVNKPSRIQTWHYNEIDSLWKVVYGGNDSVMEISYENGKRLRETYYHAGELNRFFQYRYYQDDGKLYRIYAYGKDSVQLSYRNFEYFSTGQNRVSYFTANHKLIGRRVYSSANGLPQWIEFRDSTGTVTERTDYIYDSSFKLVEKTEIKSKQTYKSVFIYH